MMNKEAKKVLCFKLHKEFPSLSLDMVLAAALQSNWKEEQTRRSLSEILENEKSASKPKKTGIHALDTAPIIQPASDVRSAVPKQLKVSNEPAPKGERVGRLVIQLHQLFPSVCLDDVFTAVLIHCPQLSVTASAVAFLENLKLQAEQNELPFSQINAEELLEYTHENGEEEDQLILLDQEDIGWLTASHGHGAAGRAPPLDDAAIAFHLASDFINEQMAEDYSRRKEKYK